MNVVVVVSAMNYVVVVRVVCRKTAGVGDCFLESFDVDRCAINVVTEMAVRSDMFAEFSE